MTDVLLEGPWSGTDRRGRTSSSSALSDPAALNWATPVDRAFVPLSRQRLAAHSRRWVDAVTAVHGAHHLRVAGLVDALVLLATAELLHVVPAVARMAFPVAFVLCAYFGQVYTDRDTIQTRGFLWYPGRIVPPLAVVGLVSVAAHVMPLGMAATLCLSSLSALTALRALTWSVLALARRRGLGLRQTLIIGDGDSAATLWRRLVEFPEAGLRPAQLLTYEQAHVPGAVAHELDAYAVRHVLLVAPGPEEALLTSALPRQAVAAPFFSTVPPLAELFLDPRSVSEVGGIPLIPLGRVTRARRTFAGKRALDLLGATLLGLVLVPVAAVVALAIKLDDGGPVFYEQQRVGRNGRGFAMLKFRTMVVGAETMLADLVGENMSDGLLFKMKDDPRITRVGRLLRRTSLDELPQVWNVVQGTMSLVGPRPLPVKVEDFAPMEAERHSVLPGITGYWQLSGGPELTYAEMVRLDLAYIRNWSLWLDLRLLLRTVPAMLHRHGAA